jgi:hypothetical protein
VILALKAWMETRARLLLGAAMLAFICAIVVLAGDAPRHQSLAEMSWRSYVWNGVYKDYVRNVYVVLVIVLGGGTLLQERAQGTIPFTLSLPVSRRALVLARAGTGLLEVIVLAAVPAVIIPALSLVASQHYPAAQAWRFAVLWATGGTLIFSGALLSATVIANEYVSWAATFLALMLFEAIVNYSGPHRLHAMDVLRLMSGVTWGTFDPAVATLSGSPPWEGVATVLTASAILLLTTGLLTRRKDFT